MIEQNEVKNIIDDNIVIKNEYPIKKTFTNKNTIKNENIIDGDFINIKNNRSYSKEKNNNHQVVNIKFNNSLKRKKKNDNKRNNIIKNLIIKIEQKEINLLLIYLLKWKDIGNKISLNIKKLKYQILKKKKSFLLSVITNKERNKGIILKKIVKMGLYNKKIKS